MNYKSKPQKIKIKLGFKKPINMPTITIGDYLKDENVIYKVIQNEAKKPQLQELLVFNSKTKQWIKGSLIAFNLSLFKKLIPKVPKITEDQFKLYQTNEK